MQTADDFRPIRIISFDQENSEPPGPRDREWTFRLVLSEEPSRDWIEAYQRAEERFSYYPEFRTQFEGSGLVFRRALNEMPARFNEIKQTVDQANQDRKNRLMVEQTQRELA